MPNKALNNPAGAFGYTEDPGLATINLVAGATITVGQVVTIELSSGLPVAIVCTAALTPVGIAATAGTTGQVIRIVTMGMITTAVAGTGGTTANTLAGVLAAGAVGPASTVGLNVGIALTTTSAAGIATVWVQPQ